MNRKPYSKAIENIEISDYKINNLSSELSKARKLEILYETPETTISKLNELHAA